MMVRIADVQVDVERGLHACIMTQAIGRRRIGCGSVETMELPSWS
jgi:hypothetical protein